MKYLQDYVEKEQTELFDKTGAFFAFGNDQFKEKAKKGEKYYNLGAGLLCPQSTSKELIEGIDRIHEKWVLQDIEENGAVGIIEREYFNHECQIGGETWRAAEAIESHVKARPDLFTEELIKTTFSNCWKKAVKNDWF